MIFSKDGMSPDPEKDQLPTAVTRKMMQLATQQDPTLQKVTEDIKTGRCRNGLTD